MAQPSPLPRQGHLDPSSATEGRTASAASGGGDTQGTAARAQVDQPEPSPTQRVPSARQHPEGEGDGDGGRGHTGDDQQQGHAAGEEIGRTLGGKVLLEHPEDLGRVKDGGTPGSIWRWPSVRKLSSRTGILWGALAQQDLGAPSVKPTRLLGNLSCALHWLHLGPPRFDPQGRYLGPLPPRMNSAPPLIGKEAGEFATSAAAAWPPQMCAGIAESIMKDIDVDRLREMGNP